MKITKLEQSGFIMETNNGFKLAIDVAKMTPLEKLDNINVDAMLVSHIHGDHFSAEHIKKLSPKKVYLNEECIVALGDESISTEVVRAGVGDTKNTEGFSVTFFNVDHGPNVSAPLKENFGFLIEIDGQKIYFAGDMFNPSGIEVSDLEVDYALLPVGGFYTFGPSEALAFSKQFKKIGKIIPMHFEMKPEQKEEFENLSKGQFYLL